LSQAKLPAQDLSRIVTEFIPKADIATLPILLESFRGRTNATIGQNLIESLLDNQKLWPNIRPRLLPAVLKGFPEKVQAEAQILIGKVAAAHQSSLAGLRSFSYLLEGAKPATVGGCSSVRLPDARPAIAWGRWGMPLAPIFPGSAVFAAAWICWKPLFNRTPAWFPDLKLIECVPNPAP
jgi:hypothetical protein